MLILENVSKLIAHTSCRSNHLIYVSMGMAVNPTVDSAFCYHTSQFYCERPINGTILELFSHQCERWHMMCSDNNPLSITFTHRLFNEIPTYLMLFIEALCR